MKLWKEKWYYFLFLVVPTNPYTFWATKQAHWEKPIIINYERGRERTYSEKHTRKKWLGIGRVCVRMWMQVSEFRPPETTAGRNYQRNVANNTWDLHLGSLIYLLCRSEREQFVWVLFIYMVGKFSLFLSFLIFILIFFNLFFFFLERYIFFFCGNYFSFWCLRRWL